MLVKNKKTEYQPIKVINNKQTILMWDYQPVTVKNSKGVEVETPLAVWQEERLNHIPTFDEIKNIITGYYNDKINEEILCGFIWNDMRVWLTNENQFNYKAAYDLAFQTNGASLPQIFKFGDNNKAVYYEFKTLEELTDFYMKAINHIKNTLEKGWQKKETINWNIYILNDIY